jgi:hypothetical protein
LILLDQNQRKRVREGLPMKGKGRVEEVATAWHMNAERRKEEGGRREEEGGRRKEGGGKEGEARDEGERRKERDKTTFRFSLFFSSYCSVEET